MFLLIDSAIHWIRNPQPWRWLLISYVSWGIMLNNVNKIKTLDFHWRTSSRDKVSRPLVRLQHLNLQSGQTCNKKLIICVTFIQYRGDTTSTKSAKCCFGYQKVLLPFPVNPFDFHIHSALPPMTSCTISLPCSTSYIGNCGLQSCTRLYSIFHPLLDLCGLHLKAEKNSLAVEVAYLLYNLRTQHCI